MAAAKAVKAVVGGRVVVVAMVMGVMEAAEAAEAVEAVVGGVLLVTMVMGVREVAMLVLVLMPMDLLPMEAVRVLSVVGVWR